MERNSNISAPALADSLSAILLLLRQILGAQARALRLNPSLQWAVWNRLLFLARRFSALVANPPKPHPSRSRKPKPTPATPALATAGPKSELSHRKGWLMLLLPGYQAAGARSQLIHLLNDPDLISLLAENPSLGRVLRPTCHMLRIPLPAYLQRPKKNRPPYLRPLRPRRPKPPPKPAQTLYQYLLEKYPPLPRPMLPGHRYKPLLNFSEP